MMRWSLMPYAYVLAGSLGMGQVAIAQVTPDTTLGIEASQVNSAVVRGAPADLIEGGAQRGENLFHSFEDFSIGELQRIYFANPADINTILSRVTGNQASEILGTLGVDGHADLFFLNPHGVVFGTNATLDIDGSLVVSTADEFEFGNGVYSAVTPETPPLLTVGLTPGLQYSAAQRSQITSSAELAVGDNLLLDAADIDIAGSLSANEDIVLRAADTASLTDDVLQPLLIGTGGNLRVQATDEVVIDALTHPDSMLASNGHLTLRSDGAIIGDGHFQSGGSFQIQQLDGRPGSFLSPNDPIIRSAGDVSFGDYEGASLHILAGGAVTANNITITEADPANGLVETVDLSQALENGTTSVAVNGQQQPTLDVRAGTTNIGAVGILGTPVPNALTVANAATSANISVDRINIDDDNGLVLLTNQYMPNSALPGNIAVRAIDTRDANGSGDVVVDSRGNIDLQTYGAIRTNAIAAATGDAGRIALIADGDVILNERYVVQARGQGEGAGGAIDVVANNLILENRTQLDTTTRGQQDGGDININVDDVVVLRGTNTRIVSLVETGATADGGDINIQADSLDITNGAGIFSGVRGIGNSGDINLNISGQTLINGTDAETTEDLSSASNSAIANIVFPGGVGASGDINLAGGSLILTDGGVITNHLGVGATVPSGQQAGDINLDLEGAILIARTAAPDRLTDSEINAPPVVGKVDVFFLADNTSSMSDIIAAVRNNASDVLDTLSGTTDTRFSEVDFGFGVGRYLDEPAQGQAPGVAYLLLTGIEEDPAAAETAISQWGAFGPSLDPGNTTRLEGNFFALQQVATSGQPTDSGVSTGQDTGWRDNTERVIVWFGDNPSFENTITQNETIEALIGNDIRVAAINTQSAGFGIDEGLQASSIANVTGGSIAHNVNTSNVSDTILTAVDETLFPDYTNVTTPRLIRNDAYPLAPSGLYLGSDITSGGQNGGLNIDAEEVTFVDNAQLSNLISGSGDGGEINIRVEGALTLQENSRFFSINNSEGRGSDVTIRAEDVFIQDRSEATLARAQSGTLTTFEGIGAIGNLDLRVDNQLVIDDRSAIGIISAGESTGNSGLATIRANDITISNGSGLTGNSTSSARGSSLDIQADNTIRLINRAQISSDTLDQAIAGDIKLTARLIQLDTSGEISTSALGTDGKGGTLIINASDAVELRNFSFLQTLAFQGSSSSGDIFVDTSRLLVESGSRIEAGTGAAGNGGDVVINATDSITISGFLDVTNRDFVEVVSTNPFFAALFESTNGANSFPVNPPIIELTAIGPTPYLAFNNPAAGEAISPFAALEFDYFFLENFEDGVLNKPGVSIAEDLNASIQFGFGDSVDEDDGSIDGIASGNTQGIWSGFREDTFTFNFSEAELTELPTHAGIVWTDVGRNGGGNPRAADLTDNVIFEAFDASGTPIVEIGPSSVGDTVINRTTAEDRFFGAINPGGISAIRLSMPGLNNWEADHLQYGFVGGTGDIEIGGGNNNVDIPPDLIDQLASIFPEIGSLRELINNPDEVTRVFSGISSVSTVDSTGDGGDITLSTQQLDLNNQAQIVSQALGTGFAGDIDINVSDRFYVDAGEVSANSDLSGGGNITINAPAPRQGVVFLRNGSLFSTSVFDSTGGGGNINIQAGGAFVAIENSDILANAEFGPGGDIEINTPAFLAGIFASGQATPVGRNPGSFEPFRSNDRVDISADSAFGNSGGLDLTDLATDQGATDLPIDLTDPSGLIDRRCSLLARRGDSEFTIQGRGGLPLSPSESTTDLVLLEDLGPNLSSDQANGQTNNPETAIVNNSRPPDQIIEPVGWERTADGSIYLRSATTTTAPELFDTRCYETEAT